MASKLTYLLRKVFFGSLAGIAASNTSSAMQTVNYIEISGSESAFNQKPDLKPKLLLKKKSNDDWTFISHRSHRSHSSHRSHYSSNTGGSGSSNSTPKSSGNSSISPNYNPNSNSGTTITTLQLGSRTLKKGMSGTDVTELVNILLTKRYLILNDGSTQVTGSYSFDDTIEDAVKKFQLDNGLTSDGICGSTTIYYLKNK